MIDLIHSAPRFNRTDVSTQSANITAYKARVESSDRPLIAMFQSVDYNLLVIGVPNVGKSSLINLLRQSNLKKLKKASRVGPEAGVTRSVLERIKVRRSRYVV